MEYRPDLDATARYWGLTRKQLIYVGVAAVALVVALVILL